jgi:hypothetical protein
VATCVGNNAQNASNNALTGLSCKTNTAAFMLFATSSASALLSKPNYTLLLKYEGCLKCCKHFVYHKGSNKTPSCPFPVGTGYKPVTFATVTAAMPAGYKAKVTAIVPVNANAPASSSAHPVTAVFLGIANLVDYVAATPPML